MPYFVSVAPLENIKIVPSNIIEEVIQNVQCILSSMQGTCPMYREFGVNNRALDRPYPIAKSIIINDIYDAIQEFEPRADIKNISFKENENNILLGRLNPVVEIEIRGS